MGGWALRLRAMSGGLPFRWQAAALESNRCWLPKGAADRSFRVG